MNCSTFMAHVFQPATTAAGAVTSPETARSPRRSGSRCATTVARLATWRVTATMPTSRSATPVGALDTSRKAVKRSSATGRQAAYSYPLTSSTVRICGGSSLSSVPFLDLLRVKARYGCICRTDPTKDLTVNG